MNDHEAIRDNIPGFVGDRLEPGESRCVQSHLDACDPCRELVTTWQDVAGALQDGGEELFEDHPSVASLREHAAGPPDQRVTRHLGVCAACGLEVTAWKRRGVAAAPARVQPGRGAWAAMAAGLFLGAGLASLTWWSLGPGSVPDWSGAAPLLTLESPLRGAATPAVAVAPEQPYFPIAVVLAPSYADADALRILISDPSGAELWSTSLTGDQVRSQLSATGVINLLVPTGEVPPGTYTLTIPGPGTDLDLPFRVEKK